MLSKFRYDELVEAVRNKDHYEAHLLKGQATDGQIYEAHREAGVEQELTQRDFDIMDELDGDIHVFLCELAGVELDWDIEHIGDIRDEVINQLTPITGMNEYYYYPYVAILERPTPKPAWNEIWSNLSKEFRGVADNAFLNDADELMKVIEGEDGEKSEDELREELVDILYAELGQVKSFLRLCGEFLPQ